MRKYKIGIIGYFATGKSKAGGQEAKTCSLDKVLKERYGKEKIFNIDTTDWKKRPISLFFSLIKSPILCENIIILPAQNSIKFFIPILILSNIFFKRKIYYSVVGGWLPDFLKNHNYIKLLLKKIDRIWVETLTMKEKLEEMNFSNVDIIVNFKYINQTPSDLLNVIYKEPFHLCTFSRIMEEKGIEDAIEVVKYVNNLYKKEIFRLDIYGKVEEQYVEKFNKILNEFPSYISYKGIIDPEDSTKVLKDYFALLFPTHYYTEGIPGTIIDAYTAGVPVICALWGNYKDVFIDGITGIGYEFNNILALKKVLEDVYNYPEKIISMKNNCLKEAQKYNPNLVIKILEKYF